MSENAVYATYSNQVTLPDVVKALGKQGFYKESIFMMLSPTHPVAEVVRDSDMFRLERGPSMARAGLIGWLTKFGAVVIPTFGFFIRSRKFFRALMEQDGLGGSGPGRTLGYLGFSPEDGERFEDQVRAGGVLLYVSCPERNRAECALELLRTAGAEETGLLLEKTLHATA